MAGRGGDAVGRSRPPSFKVGRAIHEFRVLSDGDDRPSRYADRLDEARTPYSLRLKTVKVRYAD